MCLAVPGLVLEIENGRARVDLRGNRIWAQSALVPEVRAGDYVLVHAGFILNKVDPEEARQTLKLAEEFYGLRHS